MSKADGKKGVYGAEERIRLLRVTELQGLLQSLGLSKAGRKEELRSKALAFLHNAVQSGKYDQVLAKIEEFYHKRYPVSPARQPYTPSFIPPPQFAPTNVDVRLKPLPFHEKIETLIKPRIIPQVDPRAASSVQSQSMSMEVVFTPNQSILVQTGALDGKYTTEVLLRFALCELTCEQDDQYPPRCTLSVNSTPVSLPGHQLHKPGSVEPRKFGQPVDITRYMLPAGANSVQLTCHQASDVTRKYIATIELCKKRAASELLAKVCTKVRSAELCKAFIKDKLHGGDADMEIATTSLRISLNCPLGKTRLIYPGRSSLCSHAQCFDIATYLQMNERRARWVCPVCDCAAIFDNLLIDGLMQEVLNKCSPSVEYIEYLDDGSWVPYQPRPAGKHKAPKAAGGSSATSTVEISGSEAAPFDLCDGDKQIESESRGEDDARVVIDLTLDSDDDDVGPAVLPAVTTAPVIIAPSHSLATAVASSGAAGGPLVSASAPSFASGSSNAVQSVSSASIDLALLDPLLSLGSFQSSSACPPVSSLSPSLTSFVGTDTASNLPSSGAYFSSAGSLFASPDSLLSTHQQPLVGGSSSHIPHEASCWPFEQIPGLGIPPVSQDSSGGGASTAASYCPEQHDSSHPLPYIGPGGGRLPSYYQDAASSHTAFQPFKVMPDGSVAHLYSAPQQMYAPDSGGGRSGGQSGFQL